MIRIQRSGSVALVQLSNYPDDALKVVKSITPHYWRAEDLCWEIPASAVDHLARKLYGMGEGVFVDGRGFDPIRDAAAANPFVDLLQALPERLRDQAFMGLAALLAPDIGGDEVLFTQLCLACDLVDGPRVARAKAAERQERKRDRQQAAAKRPVRRLVRTGRP